MMGKKKVLVPVDQVDLTSIKYETQVVDAPHLTGFIFKMFVKMLETPLIGSLVIAFLKRQNNMTQLLRNTVIPEEPMFKPVYPPRECESAVLVVGEDDKPEDRVELALKCLPQYDPDPHLKEDGDLKFRYWRIRDYAYAYRSGLATPSLVAENIISVLDEFHGNNPSSPVLIAIDFEDIRKQAATSTKRFEEGNPISVLDGIFVAVKDDIDCYPYPTKGATIWVDKVRSVEKDAVCVSRLRSCGVIFVGKANMHELGMGVTGNNPNYGTTRNPHDMNKYTGGSSSGPAAIVASGICAAALGTDGGGSVRIPASLCGVVGLKTTFGRTDMSGALCCGGTVEIVGPLTNTVEDSVLIYAAIMGSSPNNRSIMNPPSPCIPILSSHDNANTLGSLRLGKYTSWFHDVHTTEISVKCEDMLTLLSRTHGCETVEVVIPELGEMSHAHVVSIGSEMLCANSPDIEDGKGVMNSLDTRTSTVLFRSFGASDYIAAQRIRRRLMHYYLEIFKTVDVIVTPTAGMTAPTIHPSALKYGETDMRVAGYLMRFTVAANLLGFPAITVPVGYDKAGLPIGLQFIGRPWCEATILRLADAVERLFLAKKRPAMFYDVLKLKN